MSSGKKSWLPALFRPVSAAVEEAAETQAKAAVPALSSVPPPSPPKKLAKTGRPVESGPPALHSVPPPSSSRALEETGLLVEAAKQAALKIDPPRIVLAVDATASRGPAWEAAKRLTDALFTALPGELEVALAVHGGGRVHTFTDFVANADALRPVAARVRCKAGLTRLLDILHRVIGIERVRVVIYIGDVFEESKSMARRLAKALQTKGTRVIILHDGSPHDIENREVFEDLAARTEGAVLPFSASALDQLAELLQAVSVLAVGGTEMLEEKQAAMPAAPLLLERLAESKRLLIGNSKS
jgi:hypothetical protein